MSRRRLRKFVVPSIYVLSVTAVFISILLLGQTFNMLFNGKDNSKDTSKDVIDVIEKPGFPVVEVPEDVKKIEKPFSIDEIKIVKNFYDKSADETTQQDSLIYYENTYMQNTGILYAHSESFDIVSVFDGTVTNIKEDDLLGKIVEVKHNTNLTTVYQSLSEVSVKVGDTIAQGDKIGISGPNKIDLENKNCLLFEVYHKGLLLNPLKFYEMKIEDLSE